MSQLIYRVVFNPASILREHPPQFRHPHKKSLFELAYSGGVDSSEEIEVSRWAQQVEEPIALVSDCRVAIRADFYDYRPVGSAASAVEWHVNFADPNLFAFYGSSLFAQDEMQTVEHPMLASVREALLARGFSAKTKDDANATPILVRNVERRLSIATNPDSAAGRPYGLYGNRFATAPFEAIVRAARRVEPSTISNLIAIAAPSGGVGDYTEREIDDIFGAAFTGFAAAVGESRRVHGSSIRTAVHSGFWGCGAFGGNRRLMIALQVLAARAAGVDDLVLHAGDDSGAKEAATGIEVADELASRCGDSCSLDTLVGQIAILGCRWGVGDGN